MVQSVAPLVGKGSQDLEKGELGSQNFGRGEGGSGVGQKSSGARNLEVVKMHVFC